MVVIGPIALMILCRFGVSEDARFKEFMYAVVGYTEAAVVNVLITVIFVFLQAMRSDLHLRISSRNRLVGLGRHFMNSVGGTTQLSKIKFFVTEKIQNSDVFIFPLFFFGREIRMRTFSVCLLFIKILFFFFAPEYFRVNVSEGNNLKHFQGVRTRNLFSTLRDCDFLQNENV